MLRTAIGLTLVTAASLVAQSPQPSQPSQADSAAILTAAREWVAREWIGERDSTAARDEIEVRADTASVVVWVRASRYGRDGAKVRVERRAGQWVAVRGSRSEIMVIRP
jgi:hypothetical protein